MAETSRRQQKLQKRREAWEKEQELKNMIIKRAELNEMKVSALYYVGIPNSFVITEAYNLIDEYENLKYKRPKIGALLPDLEKALKKYEEYIDTVFEGQDTKKVVYADVCVRAYSSCCDAVVDMNDAIMRVLTGAGAKIPEFRTQVAMTMLMSDLASNMFTSVMNYNILTKGIDLRHELEPLMMEEVHSVLKKIASIALKIDEVKKDSDVDLDMEHDEAYVKAKQRFFDIIGRKNFVNSQCKEAAILNKDNHPELYKKIMKEAEKNGY